MKSNYLSGSDKVIKEIQENSSIVAKLYQLRFKVNKKISAGSPFLKGVERSEVGYGGRHVSLLLCVTLFFDVLTLLAA